MIPKSLMLLGVFLSTAHGVAAVIGTNPPALPLTVERVATLPANKQSPWKAFLKKSEQQLRADHGFFHKELREHHIAEPTTPPEAHGVRGITLDKPAEWYAQAEAL